MDMNKISGKVSRTPSRVLRGRRGPQKVDPEPVTRLAIVSYCPFCSRVPTTESQREARLNVSRPYIDPEKKAQMRAEARQRRKEMERERKKAIRAAYRRVREAKQKKDPDKEDEEDMEFDIDGEKRSSKPPPPFVDMIHNKQIMTNYKKHLLETEDKERLNMVSLYTDVENYLNLGNSKSDAKKKESHAHFIYKSYYDAQGKKHIIFSDKIKGKISERPKTAVIKEMQNYVVPKIEESFRAYIIEKASEHGMDPREFAGLSQAELSLRMGTDAALMGTWKKGRKGKDEKEVDTNDGKNERENVVSPSKFRAPKRPEVLREMVFPPCVTVNICEHTADPLHKGGRKVRFAKSEKLVENETPSESQDDTSSKGVSGQADYAASKAMYQRRARKHKTGRAQPTKEDKNEFLEALRKSASGHLTLPMLYFYKYLLKHGEEDGSPLIDKDLFFYIESQKFKDANHAYSDEELLRRKVQSIMECFLESVTSPALQIDVSAQLHEKTLRGAQRYLAGKDVIPSIFDEAQLNVFKELLPYWAGFKRTFQQPEDPNKRPVTKYQKMLRKRLEAIENYEIPQSDFNFPSIPEGSLAAYTFSLSEGVRWRDEEEVSSEEAASMIASPVDRSETMTTFRGSTAPKGHGDKKRRKSIQHSQILPIRTPATRESDSTTGTSLA